MGKKSKDENVDKTIEAQAINDQTLQDDKLDNDKANASDDVIKFSPGENVFEQHNNDTVSDDIVDEKQVKKQQAIEKKAQKNQAKKEKEDLEIAKEEAIEATKKAKKISKKTKKQNKREIAKENKAKNKADKKAAKIEMDRPKWVRSFFKKSQGLSSERMYEYLENDYANLMKRSRLLLNITDKDYEKIFIINMPDSFDNQSNVKYRFDYTKDGQQTLLYDQAYINIICFAKDVLYYYHANINYNTGRIGTEGTMQFKYKDIISIETKLGNDVITNPKYLQYNVSIHLSNNQSVTLSLRNQRLNGARNIPGLLTVQEQRIIGLLKEKIQK